MRILAAGIFSLVLFGFGACKETDEDVKPMVVPPSPTVDSVLLAAVSDTLLMKDEEFQLHASVFYSDGKVDSGGSVNWSSSDSSILAVDSNGLIKGMGDGKARIFAHLEGKADSVDFRIVDLTGTWIGGVAPDTVRYIIVQTDSLVEGLFKSHLGFPPITNVNEGVLTGDLVFPRYSHVMELRTESGCTMRITGHHTVQFEPNDEIVLRPGKGVISSPNCSLRGRIDHATLRRER